MNTLKRTKFPMIISYKPGPKIREIHLDTKISKLFLHIVKPSIWPLAI